MRIVLMGTGPFAVPSFEALLDSEHEIVALITRPLVEGRKASKQPPNPSRELGMQRGMPIHDPKSINDTESIDLLKQLDADLFVVCDYGQILSNEALTTARLGGINLHGSLLPRYRGAAPINWAIYNGEKKTGVTVIHMTPRLDGGPCLDKTIVEIGPDETTPELEERLSRLGPEIVLHSVALLEKWDGESDIGERQDPKLTTKAPRLSKQDGAVDWTRTATQIRDQIRAFKPWPGTYAFLQRENAEPLRLILDAATVEDSPADSGDADVEPGTIIESTKESLGIRCHESTLYLNRVQPAGKKVLEIEEFLRGYSPNVGDRLL